MKGRRGVGWARPRRLLRRPPVTVELGLRAILIGLVIALPVGIFSAVRQYTCIHREQPMGTAGGIVILILVLVSIFADPLARYRYEEIDPPARPPAGCVFR